MILAIPNRQILLLIVKKRILLFIYTLLYQ